MSLQKQATSAGFRRAFRSVIHAAWLYGDGTKDPVEVIKAAADFGHAQAEVTGEYFIYRPIVSATGQESALWIETYPDLMSWARTETFAQTSPDWFGTLGPMFTEGGLSMGMSEVMIDDTLDAPTARAGNAPIVHWTTFRAPMPTNLMIVPELARELASALGAAGFRESAVHFLGMPTSAGPSRTKGHFWIQHPDCASALDAIAYQERSSDLREWRKMLRSQIESVESEFLIERQDV